jgi:pyruvate kinase
LDLRGRSRSSDLGDAGSRELGKEGHALAIRNHGSAMGERAECVMLNKGPYAVTCVRVLADILKRMQAHQQKKSSLLRQLHVATFPASA